MNKNKILFLIFALFIVLHVFILNINAAEWGDSYRILRAAEYLRNFTYPANEKRPPLFSLLLAIRPNNIDQVFWGRLEMLTISIGVFWIYKKFLDLIYKDSLKRNIALVFLTLNPIYLYWSIRIMADVPFSFLALVSFYLLLLYKKSKKAKLLFVLGPLVSLSAMTRFEGYVLFISIAVGIAFIEGIDKLKFKFLFTQFKQQIKHLTVFLFSFLITILPYWYLRNPLKSSYFEEPSGRTYDLNTIAIYLLSLTFSLGFIYFGYFLYMGKKESLQFLKANIGITTFLIIELILALVWPAAIPRLFVCIIPILILFAVNGISEYFNETKYQNNTYLLIYSILLIGIYIGGQYIYKLQFLVLVKPLLLVVIIITVLQGLFLIKKNLTLFLTAVFLTAFVWSFATIWIHKDIFKVVKDANEYVVLHLNGKVGYNDVSSVSNWYLNDSGINDNVEGTYYDLTRKDLAKRDSLIEKEISYLMVTNEHNTDLEIDISNKSYLEEVVTFKKEINGKEFFTKIIKFNINE